MKCHVTRWLTILVSLWTGWPTAFAQIPDTFTNLQVLPKDVSKGELMGSMKGFTWALGVRCEFCHVGDPEQGFATFDFAADDREPKRTARIMMRMVQNINQTQLAALSSREGVKVECVTCHRGQKEPRLLEDVLTTRQDTEGLEAALALYEDLRSEYYGSHTYDFSERTLLRVAETSLTLGNSDAAIRWTRKNIEYHPESAFSHFQLGMIHAQAGNQDAAIASLERALELNPNIRPAKKMLQQLKGE